jgi:hypothetical protein
MKSLAEQPSIRPRVPRSWKPIGAPLSPTVAADGAAVRNAGSQASLWVSKQAAEQPAACPLTHQGPEVAPPGDPVGGRRQGDRGVDRWRQS